MDLKTFAQESVKLAASGKTGIAERAWKWMTTKKVSPSLFGGHAETAKKILDKAGKKLTAEEKVHAELISKGHGPHPAGTRKFLKGLAKKHDVREMSLLKPALAVGSVGGAAMGVSSARRNRPAGYHVIDRSPQLVQNPSRVVY